LADRRKPTEPGPSQHQDEGYVHAQRRRSLYRVLATNIVRELRSAGYHGHELLAFASEVIRAITDHGWQDQPRPDEQARRRGPDLPAAGHLSVDQTGRPTIVGDRIILRPPTLTDRACLEAWAGDPLVRSSLIPSVLSYIMENLDTLHTRSDRLDLIICDRTTQKAIGLVSLHDIDPHRGQAELGKTVGDPGFRGKGIAEMATRLIVAYGFDSLGLNRIYLRTLGANVRNIRLNERVGFRFEGLLRQAARVNGQPADVVLMAMLRSEVQTGPGE